MTTSKNGGLIYVCGGRCVMKKTGILYIYIYICWRWSLHKDEKRGLIYVCSGRCVMMKNGGPIYVCGGRCIRMKNGVLYMFVMVVAKC